MAAALEATERKASTSALAPSKTSGHQKWKGTAESLNARPTMIMRPARTRTMSGAAVAGGDQAGDVHRGEFGGDRWQVGGAGEAGEEADAVEHDAGGAGAVDGVFERGFARAAAAFDDAGHDVRRHARHFDGEEDGHEVVGGGHQAHAERRAEQERVKVLAVLAIGEAGEADEDDEQRRRTRAGRGGRRRSSNRRPACQ